MQMPSRTSFRWAQDNVSMAKQSRAPMHPAPKPSNIYRPRANIDDMPICDAQTINFAIDVHPVFLRQSKTSDQIWLSTI